MCLVGESVKVTFRNRMEDGNNPTKMFVPVGAAENICQQCRELVDNPTLRRRLFTNSQKAKTCPNHSQIICRNCSDRNETLAKKVFLVRKHFSETREKLGSICVKRLTKLSDEKQLDRPTEKSVNIKEMLNTTSCNSSLVTRRSPPAPSTRLGAKCRDITE